MLTHFTWPMALVLLPLLLASGKLENHKKGKKKCIEEEEISYG